MSNTTSRVRRARTMRHGCHVTQPGELYIEHVEFPGGDADWATSGRPVRMNECRACAERYGRSALIDAYLGARQIAETDTDRPIIGTQPQEETMTETATYERLFVTQDKATTPAGNDIDVTFNVIEDESGDIFWGYGHVEQTKFIAELNRWLVHTIGEGEEIWDTTPVEHLWAAMNDEYGERFTLIDPQSLAELAEAFPVTRVML